ncbi:MAG: hypothetical protein U9R29_02315 [Thermodesulfobacteriota bacterium]|nr:hypothetical protein [Thermodesulfobacteriota bacterium]
MRQGVRGLIVCALFCVATVVNAASWPQVENRLQQWQGTKEISLPRGVDPFEDELFAPVAETALMQGYMILPDGVATKTGLMFSTRETSRGKMLVLKRGEDGALLAMEKISVDKAPAMLSTATAPAAVAPAMATVVAPSAPVKPAPMVQSVALATPQRSIAPVIAATSTTLSVQHPALAIPQSEVVFEMDGTPVQVVVWPVASGGVDLYVMYDDAVQRMHSDGGRLQLKERFEAPVSPVRALRLDIGDMDNDGQPELAAVWAEDIRGVSDGTNSLLHGWILSVAKDDSLQAISEDLTGYLALSGNQAYLQKRLEYAAFAPEVYALSLAGGAVTISEKPIRLDTRLLFDQLQWPDNNSALVWNDDDRLMLVAQGSNTRIAGSTLLTDFGQYQGPTVSIPLQEPEYLSGFSANDRIMAREITLGRRMVQQQDAVFTIVRGRTPGMLLVTRDSGADRLVKISKTGRGLNASYPFAAIDAFIVDFAMQGQEAVVLLNEKADGSGRAYLRLQQSL